MAAPATKMLTGGDPADEANWLECIAIIAGLAGADSDAILITDPGNGKLFTRPGWYDTHDKPDPLSMIAGTRVHKGYQRAWNSSWRKIKC